MSFIGFTVVMEPWATVIAGSAGLLRCMEKLGTLNRWLRINHLDFSTDDVPHISDPDAFKKVGAFLHKRTPVLEGRSVKVSDSMPRLAFKRWEQSADRGTGGTYLWAYTNIALDHRAIPFPPGTTGVVTLERVVPLLTELQGMVDKAYSGLCDAGTNPIPSPEVMILGYEDCIHVFLGRSLISLKREELHAYD